MTDFTSLGVKAIRDGVRADVRPSQFLKFWRRDDALLS